MTIKRIIAPDIQSAPHLHTAIEGLYNAGYALVKADELENLEYENLKQGSMLHVAIEWLRDPKLGRNVTREELIEELEKASGWTELVALRQNLS